MLFTFLFTEFEKWKFDIQSRTVAQFNLTDKSDTTKYFICNRYGDDSHLQPQEPGIKRHHPTGGSRKSTYACPAFLRLNGHKDGTFHLEYCLEHLDHEMTHTKVDLQPSDKYRILRLATQIPDLDNSAIIRYFGDSGGPNNPRLQNLKRQDIDNLRKQFNVYAYPRFDDNDLKSLDQYIKCVKDDPHSPFLYYKPYYPSYMHYYSSEHDYPSHFDAEYDPESFILIIMDHGQKNLLKKYGSKCIAVDSTHQTNPNGLLLVNLMVVDDNG